VRLKERYYVGREEECIQDFVENREGRRPLGRPEVSGRIILKQFSEKVDILVRTGFVWFRIGTSSGLM
jgi:hypothetical protein